MRFDRCLCMNPGPKHLWLAIQGSAVHGSTFITKLVCSTPNY